MTASTEVPVQASPRPAAGRESARALAPESPGRVPDLFIVGHPKCGTTALYDMLGTHPQIFTPALPEPAFFASELPRRDHRVALPASLEEYSALFASAGREQIVCERSAMYLWSASAASAIAAVQPGARIVALLREPASFLRSLHLQNLQSHYETETDLGAALELEQERRRGRRIPRRCRRPQVLLYSEYVRYAEQLGRYRAHFGAEQMLVLIYEDYRTDNEGTLRRILSFAGADERVPIAPTEANKTVRMRSQRLDELVHSVSVGRGPLSRAVKRSVKTLAPAPLRRQALGEVRRRMILAPPPPVDDALMLQLRQRFKPEVLAAGEYLGRDLASLWGYDRIH
jgi:hypothetical protein